MTSIKDRKYAIAWTNKSSLEDELVPVTYNASLRKLEKLRIVKLFNYHFMRNSGTFNYVMSKKYIFVCPKWKISILHEATNKANVHITSGLVLQI